MKERKIKLIWDLRGPDASKTAEHHAIHLKEYVVSENLTEKITGYQTLSPMHSIAFLVVSEAEMISVRDILKPHRGEFYEE
ncbi:hypothetical protein K8352_01990 [Flavobacteriaceae bacterium F89]|uniref:Uncharacterized protein n=1 Tax=Cerina litoralis TaxID=2874477 RepID=A0AAE3ES88_9FLAO|nr:hypothetical protein [Cerina litoralis]MCG2459513.1 hypothetical protein [Cerina litoralis]